MLENKSLTFEKAVDVCRASEVARNTRTELRNDAIAKVSAFKQQKSQTREHFATYDVTRRCEQCGYRRHKDPMACPAIDASCRKCSVSDHFQSVCGRFDAFDTSDNSTERPTEKNVPMPTTSKTGERRPRWYERHVRQTIADVYIQGSASRPMPQVSVTVTHPADVATFRCMPDTGAESTVMGSQLAHHLGIDISHLLPTHASFSAIGGKALKCKDQVRCSLELGDRHTEADVHVIDNLPRMLISWFDCSALGIVPADFAHQINMLVSDQRDAGCDVAALVNADHVNMETEQDGSHVTSAQLPTWPHNATPSEHMLLKFRHISVMCLTKNQRCAQ